MTQLASSPVTSAYLFIIFNKQDPTNFGCLYIYKNIIIVNIVKMVHKCVCGFTCFACKKINEYNLDKSEYDFNW
jgi:hypothetical protein